MGTAYGLVSGYFSRWVDNVMMRFVDLMYAFPSLLLIILMMAFFRSSLAQTEPGTFAYTTKLTNASVGCSSFSSALA